jgi:hypothetical protein
MNLTKAVMMALQGAPIDAPIFCSAFDPKLLLEATTDQANSTERVPVPVGEHVAVIAEVNIRSGNKNGNDWAFLDVTYDIDNPAVKEALGRQKVTLTQGVGLDFTPNGGLDYSKGKNVQLGRLRDCVGLNVPGQPFSFRMLQGKVLKIVVSHSPDTRPTARAGDVYENVSGFVKA